MNHLSKLEGEHAELDNRIMAEQKRPAPDLDLVRALKRRKLHKKDEIVAFRATLEPERKRA